MYFVWVVAGRYPVSFESSPLNAANTPPSIQRPAERYPFCYRGFLFYGIRDIDAVTCYVHKPAAWCNRIQVADAKCVDRALFHQGETARSGHQVSESAHSGTRDYVGA